MPVVGGLSEDSVQVLQPGVDTDHHLPSLRRLVRARVHGGMEALTDFLYTGLQFLALLRIKLLSWKPSTISVRLEFLKCVHISFFPKRKSVHNTCIDFLLRC